MIVRGATECSDLPKWAGENSVPELYVPKKIVAGVELSTLGNGKLYNVALQSLAEG